MRIEARDGRGLGRLGARGLTAEVNFWFDLCEGKRHGAGIAESGERIDPRAAGIAEAEQLRDLVEGLARGIVHGAAHQRVAPRGVHRADEIEMRVSAGDDEGKGWVAARVGAAPVRRAILGRAFGLALVQEHGVNVAFEMVHGNQRKTIGEGEGLGVGNANKKRSGQAWAGGDSDGVEIGKRDVRLGKRGANHGNNGAEMFAAGQLRHHAAIARMRRDLRGDDRGNGARAPLHDRRGGFVAGAFNAEDEAGAGHILSVVGGVRC